MVSFGCLVINVNVYVMFINYKNECNLFCKHKHFAQFYYRGTHN